MQQVLIGVDIGTTVVKSVAFDLSGREVALSRSQNLACRFSGKHAECDMEKLWECVYVTLQELVGTKLNPEEYEVAAISVAGTMVGLWMLDRDGKPFHPAILWNDGRSVELLERWMQDGTSQEIFKEAYTTMNPGFTVPLMCWMKEHEPEVLDRAGHIFFCKDWIRYCLTGEFYTEETDASHIPGNLEGHCISEHILDLTGLGKYKDCFPPCLKATDVAGYITEEAAKLTGLKQGIPVIAGLADVSASIVGAGGIAAGDRTLILGTSCLCTLTADHPIPEPKQVGLSFLLPQSRYVRVLPNQTGMMAVNWFYNEVIGGGKDVPYDERRKLEEVMEQTIPIGSEGLMFHPYLNNTGLVAPQYAPRARGQFHGLSISHNRYHMLRAVYEGLAFAVCDCYTALNGGTKPIRFVGGGTKNTCLSQIISDVMGAPLQMLENQETGALGTAIAAGIGVGIYKNLEQAVSECCHFSGVVTPNKEKFEQYQSLFDHYQRIREMIVAECCSRKETEHG